ncbi:hypothetical protein GCM10025779_17090 [Arthrobacter cryoconiti]
MIQGTHYAGWRTVKAALVSASPSQRAEYVKRESKLDPLKEFIDARLVPNLDAPRKQRHATLC